MKFSLFIHMERVDPAEDQRQLYEEMIALCEIADRGGMHAIWSGEHHAMNFTIAPNPFLTLVDLGAAHEERAAGHRDGDGAAVASYPARGRGGDGRYHDGRAAGAGGGARRLYVRI